MITLNIVNVKRRTVSNLWWMIPYREYQVKRKWRQRPGIGDRVEDCRYQIHTVVGFVGGDEDNLLFEDGSSASWMHCCDPVSE